MRSIIEELGNITYDGNSKYEKFFKIFEKEFKSFLDLLKADNVVFEIFKDTAKGEFTVDDITYGFHYGMAGWFDGREICIKTTAEHNFFLSLDDKEVMKQEFANQIVKLQIAA